MIRLFRVFIPKSVVAVLIVDFILVTACFLVLSALILPEPTIYLLYENGIATMLFCVLALMAALYWQDAYNELQFQSIIRIMQQVFVALGFEFLVQAFLAYLNVDLIAPRRVNIAMIPVVLVVLPLWRLLLSRAVYAGFAAERLLFIGTAPLGFEIANQVRERPELGIGIVGFLADDLPDNVELPKGTRVVGRIADVGAAVAELRPQRLIVALTERRQVLPVETLMDLRLSGMRIDELGYLYEQVYGRVSAQLLRPSHLIFSAELGPKQSSLRLQTAYSFICALIGIIVAAPVMAIVAIAVAVTSPGPVLFRQKRVGLNGKTFTLYKFRSMGVDAEARTGAVWATKNDPRVTRIGGFLRRTRLDELPQLFNMLKGDMVAVGPRPERPEFVATLSEKIPFYRQRHCVKPGVTGWAQINYKYGETFQDAVMKLEYDLYYIKNVSFSLDMYVVFHTLKVMLVSGHGQ